MSERYIAQFGSGHKCCFDWSVADTTQPLHEAGPHESVLYKTICECTKEDLAHKIADALNAFNPINLES